MVKFGLRFLSVDIKMSMPFALTFWAVISLWDLVSFGLFFLVRNSFRIVCRMLVGMLLLFLITLHLITFNYITTPYFTHYTCLYQWLQRDVEWPTFPQFLHCTLFLFLRNLHETIECIQNLICRRLEIFPFDTNCTIYYIGRSLLSCADHFAEKRRTEENWTLPGCPLFNSSNTTLDSK